MSKKDVVKAFKALLRITEKTFEGDKRALFEAKQKIQMEFRKELEPETQVEDKLKIASEVGNILKHQVVQLSKKQDSDNYRKWQSFCLSEFSEISFF